MMSHVTCNMSSKKEKRTFSMYIYNYSLVTVTVNTEPIPSYQALDDNLDTSYLSQIRVAINIIL